MYHRRAPPVARNNYECAISVIFNSLKDIFMLQNQKLSIFTHLMLPKYKKENLMHAAVLF